MIEITCDSCNRALMVGDFVCCPRCSNDLEVKLTQWQNRCEKLIEEKKSLKALLSKGTTLPTSPSVSSTSRKAST